MKCTIVLIFLLFLAEGFNQTLSLRDTTNQYDYIIITVPEFVSSCEVFKLHKQNVRGFKVLIADTQQIFSEFNSRLTKQDNIREFISYAGTFWRSPRPKYFLLAGSLTKIVNYKVISIPGFPYTDTVMTDFYYSISIYSADTLKINFSVGRVSANTQTELINFFNKIITYESNSTLSPWNNRALLIADDGKTPTQNAGDYFERIAFLLAGKLPEYIIPKFIFQSDTSRFYGNRDSILKYFQEDGTAIVFFLGFSNGIQFTHENMFHLNDVELIQNDPKYFIFAFLGCNQTMSDTVIRSISDKLILHNSASIGGYAPTGVIWGSIGSMFLEQVSKRIFRSPNLSLGEIHLSAMNTILEPSVYYTLRLYNIFGDPSLKLRFDISAGSENPTGKNPTIYLLKQNYPNPFNPKTAISFSIPNQNFVVLKIFDVLGNEVAVLVNEEKSPGHYQIDFDASRFSSGVYLYQLRSGNFISTKKMILIK